MHLALTGFFLLTLCVRSIHVVTCSCKAVSHSSSWLCLSTALMMGIWILSTLGLWQRKVLLTFLLVIWWPQLPCLWEVFLDGISGSWGRICLALGRNHLTIFPSGGTSCNSHKLRARVQLLFLFCFLSAFPVGGAHWMSGNSIEKVAIHFLESFTPSNVSFGPLGSPSPGTQCPSLANLDKSPLLRKILCPHPP